jgi:SAM-dependent methyltransferase
MRAAARYDRDHGAPRRELNTILERFAATVPADARVVEIGAGVYDHTSLFAARVETFNADPATRPDILGDAHDMPIPDATYDVAVCISTLEHVRDPYRCTREIRRILKPGGRCFAWIPFYFGVHDFPIDVSRFTREGCVVLFEEAGFDAVEADAEPWSGLFHNLHNTVHFVLPRASHRAWVRRANRLLLALVRLGFPLDRRLRLRTLYAGSAIVATVAPEPRQVVP